MLASRLLRCRISSARCLSSSRLVFSNSRFSTSCRRRRDNHYNLAGPNNGDIKQDKETTTSQQLPGRVEPRLSLTFTCTVKECDERSTHEFSKRAYTTGIVLVECPKCKNRYYQCCSYCDVCRSNIGYRHLISDHLGWFKESTMDGKLRTVEEIVKERGEKVKKGRLTFGGDVEYFE